jgi:hypothetical protein
MNPRRVALLDRPARDLGLARPDRAKSGTVATMSFRLVMPAMASTLDNTAGSYRDTQYPDDADALIDSALKKPGCLQARHLEPPTTAARDLNSRRSMIR